MLRHVHDVAFTLVPRWPPCTLYQSREDDVDCVVRSIAKRSLFDGALADICTSAGPSPTSLCLLAGSQCVTRPPGYGYLVFADARLVHALSDQWKLHSMSGLPRLVWSVQHVKTLRGRRHWRPATSQNLRVSSIYATEPRCRVSTRASHFRRLWLSLSTRTFILVDFCSVLNVSNMCGAGTLASPGAKVYNCYPCSHPAR